MKQAFLPACFSSSGSGLLNAFAYTLCLLLQILATDVSATGTGNLEKKFQAAVEMEDYNLVLRLGPSLVALQTAGSRTEDASATYRQIASACFFRGEYSKAIDYCISGLALLKDGKPDDLAFRHTSTIAECYVNLSLLDSAGYWFGKSEELLKGNSTLLVKTGPFVQTFYNNFGSYHLQKGDIYRALIYYEKALTIARTLEDRAGIGISYNSIANHYNQTGRFDLAQEYYKKAIGYFPSVSADRSWILLSLSRNELKRNDYKKALLDILESRRLYETFIKQKPGSRNSTLEKRQLLQLARCYAATGDTLSAITSYQLCIRQSGEENIRVSEELSACFIGLGLVAEAGKKYREALLFYQKALIAGSIRFSSADYRDNPVVGNILSGHTVLDALIKKAACLKRLSPYGPDPDHYREISLDTYERAVSLGEKLRKDMGVQASKLFFSERLRPVFDSAIDTSYELFLSSGKAEKWSRRTITLLERSRQVVLSDILHEQYIRPLSLPKEMLEKENRLHREISLCKVQYIQAESDAARDSLKIMLNDLEVGEQDLHHQMELLNPSYVRLRHKTQPFRIDLVSAGLDDQTAYLGYYMGKDKLYFYSITRNNTSLECHKLSPDLPDKIRLLKKSLQTDPELYAFEAAGVVSYLYDFLVKPCYDKVSSYPRWLIARDGVLNLIPFEILGPSEQPLWRLHSMAYLHSAETLQNASSKKFATNTIGFAPFSKQYASLQSPDFGVLEKTGEEVAETSDLFFLNEEATKDRFLQTVDKADILHLATHGSYNDSIPDHSFIAFSPHSGNNRLYAHEIAGLSMQHMKMALLSFCDADLGRSYNGEGVISLARAFRMAGCPGVLATLWKADDEITSYIVRMFYRHLRKGKPADVALQAAKEDYFSSPLGKAWNHPFFWSHIVYIGDPDPVYPAPSNRPLVIAFTVAPVLLLLLFFFRKKTSP